MNVFVLTAGRTGSVAFSKACQHISNYTAAHESRNQLTGSTRFDFPENHIEVDNRLSWFLGRLDKRYGKNAFYVHLLREEINAARSYSTRWHATGSIIDAYNRAILMRPTRPKKGAARLEVQRDYIDTVTANIQLFLADKPMQITISIEQAKLEFPSFWQAIGAEGDLSAALAEFDYRHNPRKQAATLRAIVRKLKLALPGGR